jgi:hypothetical protein
VTPAKSAANRLRAPRSGHLRTPAAS